MKNKKLKKKSFEDALEKLEKIVQKLEQGDLSLDESLELFQEGVMLAQFCTEKLNQAEEKVLKLIKTEQGKFKTEPLDREDEEQEEV
jgi:exodeoxyribonuclease VII small subunit